MKTESQVSSTVGFTLSDLSPAVKRILIAMLITLTIGVSLGLLVVFVTTTALPSGITAHYQGDNPEDIDLIPDNYPMPIKELLITTHNHILGFTFIFGFLGLLIQLSATPGPGLKQFLGLEPFVSIILTFGSMWGIRFLSGTFVWLMMFSSTLLYLSFYVMVAILLMELLRLRKEPEQ